nr:dTDP-4-dehydrorhamnose 3,5-epimerase [uncultured Pseudogulbenkiania sp.]
MKIIETALNGLLLLEPVVFADERGEFCETFNARRFAALIGREVSFVQDNRSRSRPNVLRGLHYQHAHPQGKLVQVTQGAVWDVAVDLRRASPSFGQWYGVTLSAENRRQLWIPEGFAHGFLALQDGAEFCYKVSDYWHAGDEYCIRWDDPALGIDWPLTQPPVLSDKDRQGLSFAEAPRF